MRVRFCLLICKCILLIALASSCIKSVTYEEMSNKPKENPCGIGTGDQRARQAGNPVRGTWVDNVFVNEYLGLKFDKPYGWRVSPDGVLAFWSGGSLGCVNMPDEETLLSDDLWDYLGWINIYDMMVTNPNTFLEVNMLFTQLEYPEQGSAEFRDFLQDIYATMLDVRTIDICGTTRIGSLDWYSYGTVTRVMGIDYYERHFINVHDGFASIIVIHHRDDTESVDDILSMFNCVYTMPIHG